MATAHNTLVPSAISPVIPSSKRCSKCGVDKPLSEFSSDRSKKLGIDSRCKRCNCKRSREQYHANPERAKAYDAMYRARMSPQQKERSSLTTVRGNMIARCYRPNAINYMNYGGRGITVCQRWLDSLDTFIADMGPRPAGYQLDRIDNDAGYSPENCRWATLAENAQNKRMNRNNKLGITGVTWFQEAGYSRGRYRAEITRNGILRQKYFYDFFEACCYRKSLENQFNNTGEI